MKILGYLKFDMYFWPLNVLLFTTRKYIFWCATNTYLPDTYFLHKEIKRRFIEQKLLYTTKSKFFAFHKNWTMLGNFFDDIEI